MKLACSPVRLLLAVLAVPAAAVRLRATAPAVALEHRTSEVRKPLTDKREYHNTVFESGLKVLVVNDPEAEKTSYAVAVEAGSLEDPKDFQGLAHFLEHMVFLGSKKYPDEGEYSAQLALYGGNHNAYTSAEETVYYNEIGNEGADKALDIFSQFFIAPSLDAAMVDKEVNAVDSEHKKNMPDTQRRLWHLLRSKANPESPVSKFATGDLETLKTKPESEGKSLVKALQEFHANNYCSKRLHLVLISNRTVDEQLAMAHKHFDALPAAEHCTARPVYTDKPMYTKELKNLGKRYTVHNSGSPQMWVVMPLPPLKSHYKEMAEAYVWNVLGNYGPGSLKALLLAEDLSPSYSYYADNSVAGSTMMVTFQLTAKGLTNKDKVLEYFFAYINAAKAAGINMDLVSSVKQLRQVEFDYQEKKASEFNFVSSLAGATPSYAPADLLTGGILMDSPNKEMMMSVLEHMRPDNMNVAIVSPDFKETSGNAHEQYYDFKYLDEDIEPELVTRLTAASGFGLVAPPDLAFVPRNTALITEGVKAGSPPEQLVAKGRTEAWWLGLGDIKLPKAIISIKLGFPTSIINRVEDSVLAAMHSRMVNMVLEQPTDAMQTCGVTYSVGSSKDGLSISFSGFDEHILELMKMVLPRVRNPESSDAQFEQAKRQFVLDLADVTKLQPYQHALEAFDVVTMKGRYSRAELLKAAQDATLVSPEAHKRFLEEIFEETELTILFTGNVGRDRSKAITEEVETQLGVKNTKMPEEKEGHLLVLKPSEPVEIRIANPIPEDPNSATLVTYQFGIPSVADRIHLAMLGEFIDRPVFETLRTEHQLGYVVFGYVTTHASIVEVRVLVQGFREGPDAVQMLIESTVQNLTSKIANMSEDEFKTRKATLRSTLDNPPKTLSQYAGKYWGQIWEREYCWQKTALQLAVLDDPKFSSPAPLLQAWKNTVEPGHQKKVTVKLYGSGLAQNATLAQHVKTVTLVDSAAVTKAMGTAEYWPHQYMCE